MLDNKNSPAFPVTEEESDRLDEGVKIYTGLTKREYFAAKALQGLCSRELDESATNKVIGEISVVLADALIEALNK